MNMFARKAKAINSQTTADESSRKKFASKILDAKKEVNGRLKYLKIFIESSDNVVELKQFFDNNYSQIFLIFYESFINLETNLKQKLSKFNKEEFETVLFVFQKILVLQPERIHQRWQVRSIGRTLQKLLHIGNAKFIKINGLRLFLIWYQILNVNRTHVEELMFQKLIQGFDTLFHSSLVQISGQGGSIAGLDMLNAEAHKVFASFEGGPNSAMGGVGGASSSSSSSSPAHATGAHALARSIYAYEIAPLLPLNPNSADMLMQQQQSQSGQQNAATTVSGSISSASGSTAAGASEGGLMMASQQQLFGSAASQQPTTVYGLTAELLRNMLDFMQHDCLTIEWQTDKMGQSLKCYEFLFDEFKRFYLAYMFPSAFLNTTATTTNTNTNTSSNTTSSNVNNTPNTSFRSNSLTGSTPATPQSVAHPINHSHLSHHALNVYSNFDLLGILQESANALSLSGSLSSGGVNNVNDDKKQTQLHCKEEIIRWLVGVLVIDQIPPSVNNQQTVTTSSSISAGLSSGATTPSGGDQFYSSFSSSTLNSLGASAASDLNLSISSKSRFNDADSLRASQDTFMLNDYDSNYSSDLQSTGGGTVSSITSSTTTITNFTLPSNTSSAASKLLINKQLIQRVILSTPNNVNLVHEILRNAYFLNFDDNLTIKLVLDAHKKWFLKEAKMPSFMLEPPPQLQALNQQQHQSDQQQQQQHQYSNILDTSMQSSDAVSIHTSSEVPNTAATEDAMSTTTSSGLLLPTYPRTSSVSSTSSALSASSVAAAIANIDPVLLTRIGYAKSLQIFFYHSSNLLLNRNNLHKDKIKNVSCYVLEIYKMFIRKIKMDHYTWTLLITILLRVSEFLFNSEFLINNRNDPASSQLIKIITETMLLSMIKSSFCFNMSNDLWDQLMNMLAMVNSNPDVIDKWMESIDDLIRQVIKYCYGVDINNLPINESTTDQKRKIKKKNVYNGVPAATTTPSSQNGLPVIKGSVGGAPNQQQTQPAQQQPVFRQPQQTASNMLTKPRSRTEIYHPAPQPTINPSTLSAAAAAAAAAVAANSTAASSIATVNSPPSAAQHHHHQHKAPTIRESGSVSAAVANIPPQTPTTPAFQHAQQQAPSTALVNRQRTMTAAEIETTKSPSLSDEHFISSVDQTGGSQTPTSSNKAASVSPRQQTSKPGGETTSGVTTDYDEEYDENDDEAFDRSATLKAVTVNTTTSNGGYNSTVFFAPGATSPVSTAAAAARLLSDGEASSSNEKMINRFNSDKSIYYSSEHLAETAGSNTSSNLDESNSSATVTSPSNQQQQQKQSVPPPLPPLPTNLSSKYNRYINAMATSVSGESGGQANNLQPPPLPLTSPPSLTPTTPATQQLLISTFETNDQVDAAAANALHHGTGSNEQRKLKGLSMLSADLELAGTGGGGGFTSSEEGEMSGNDTTNYASPNNISVNATNPAAATTTNTTISSTASSQLSETVISNTAAQLDSTSGNSSGSSSNTGLLATATATTVDRSSVERSASFITNSGGGNDATLKPQRAVDKPPAQSTAITTTFRDISLMLIKRLFGCLGNVNSIKDPIVHRRVLEFILAKWERLARVKDELRLKDLTQIVMPASYFAPWLFEAVYQLPASYQSGKLIAYKTLCHIIIRSAQAHTSLNYYYYDIQQLNGDFDSIDDEFIDLFYLTLHQGFVSNDRNVINCLIQNTGTKFWHCMLPSSTLLLKDFIDACCLVDSQGPKYEAASILGCLICFADFFGDMKVLSNGTQSTITSSSSSPSSSLSPSASLTTSPNTSGGQQQQPQQISPSSNKSPSSQKPTDSSGLIVENASKDEIKNLIIQSLVAFNDDYFNNNSRCVILCALTCFIYDEILNQRWNIKRLNEAIKRIFKDLDFRDQFNPVLVKMSCDNLRFLSCLAHLIFQKDIQYAIDIINVLNQCLVKLINTKPTILNEDYEKAIIANMFALLEWCMNMPLEQLKDHDRATLLRNNFKLIIHISNTFKPNESIEAEHIHLSAKFIITHLLNQLNHFPFGYSGAAKIVSSVNEISDLGLNLDDLSPQLFDQSNIQFFTINNQFLVSFVELPIKNNEKYFSISPRLKVSSSACRFIVRDFSGKYCWDSCVLTTPDDTLPNSYFLDIPFKNRPKFTVELPGVSSSSHSDTNSTFDYTEFANLSHENIPKDIDLLDNVLMYINYSSPECRFEPNRPLNIVWELNANTNAQLNVDEVKNKLSNQSVTEQKHVIEQHEDEMNELEEKKDNFVPPKEKQQQQQSQSTSNDSNLQYYYHLCKSFVHEMGLLSWEKRQSFNLLHKSAQLLRELKSLDDQTCRETHKIALIYIGEGQEERSTILSNECGSKDYEDFLAALAWPVDLETHEGFMGGLQHNYQLKTAPYYANSICEVLFHVSTQMNNENDQNKISKWRHLGNDSVQIIWSEHTRDYDRNILATEFADVIICIYPLRNGLFRIQIIKKPSVGYFGPLFDGAIVNKQTLPTLIRATAVNASRVLLSNTKGYQDFFVHRAHALNNIIKTQTEKQTFEQFIVDIYSPASINPASTQMSSSSNYQQATVSTHPSSSSINLKAKESTMNADSNTTTTNTNSTDSYVK